jgi:hypothetical protein
MERTIETTGLTFDVAALFAAKPIKRALDNIILHVPEGCSPRSLRDNAIGAELIWQDNTWYDKYEWAKTPIPSGTYHLRLPVPDSNRKTFQEQHALLRDGEEPAPLALVMLALLCCRLQGLPDPLNGDFVRCREVDADGDRVALRWNDGRLVVDGAWDVYRDVVVWLAAAGTS